MQDAFERKEEHESRYRKREAAKNVCGPFRPTTGPQTWVTSKIKP